MTHDEAKALLNLEEEFDQDDILDALQEKLFEFKQYFLSKPVISKLFHGQLAKVSKLNEAARQLGYWLENRECKEFLVDFPQEISSIVLQFEKHKSMLKKQVANANNAEELRCSILALLSLQGQYVRHWPEIEVVPDSILLSKEADIMELIADIRQMELNGISSFDEVKKSNAEHYLTFVNEWKRLSLLAQKEEEWKKGFSIS